MSKFNENLSKAMLGKQNALKSDEPRDTQLQLRVNSREKEQWKKDAQANGYVSLSDYVIDLLNGDLT